MDAMVTARVPVEVKRQAEEVLRAKGSNLSEAVNAVLIYVIDTGQLPREDETVAGRNSNKHLSPQQRDELRQSLRACTVTAPDSFWDQYPDPTYRDIISEGRAAAYEALS